MKAFKFSRRGFLSTSSLACLGGATAFAGISRFFRRTKDLLRPPGALKESLFLASCIKCGQCLQVCPPQVIKLGGLDQGLGIGTPYINAREGACILCKGLPCVLACPTGALDHDISEGTEANMGLAVLTGLDTCLAIKGEDCTICLDECPIKEVAPIEFYRGTGETDHPNSRMPIVMDTCVGCGVCEEKCPVEPAAIVVVPRLRPEGDA